MTWCPHEKCLNIFPREFGIVKCFFVNVNSHVGSVISTDWTILMLCIRVYTENKIPKHTEVKLLTIMRKHFFQFFIFWKKCFLGVILWRVEIINPTLVRLPVFILIYLELNLWRRVIIEIDHIVICSRFSSNSEAFASELLWNLEKMFPRYYMYIGVCSCI